jgi:hypothetical protein
MKLPLYTSFRLGFWVLLLLSVFAWAPATHPGYWEALEGFAPTFNVDQPGSLASVAIAPDLWRGSGRATFLLTRPLILLGVDAVTAVRITFIIAFLLGGLGMYAWLRTHLGDRSAAFAGLLYMLAPPLLATVYDYLRRNQSDQRRRHHPGGNWVDVADPSRVGALLFGALAALCAGGGTQLDGDAGGGGE